jgi:hypothetical protein
VLLARLVLGRGTMALLAAALLVQGLWLGAAYAAALGAFILGVQLPGLVAGWVLDRRDRRVREAWQAAQGEARYRQQ